MQNDICAGTDLARQALLTDLQLAERFEAFHLERWSNDLRLTQLLSSLASIFPLRQPSAIASPAVRRRVLELTDGVTVRILRSMRLMETVANDAIHNGSECITADSFSREDLVLPLVSMVRRSERSLQRRPAR